ncbi:coiled-coil domain-containing protein 69-A-like [Xenopus laevis]|uniref:Coiled-coil domain-containing protein 69-A-like n=1 Tax=Xenopus laevis TaxID=8355 RepID=A0A8J1LRS7_XENLA|nr:coiled-coil domain-containing protein 69-A-like [Xenopus laevis]
MPFSSLQSLAVTDKNLIEICLEEQIPWEEIKLTEQIENIEEQMTSAQDTVAELKAQLFSINDVLMQGRPLVQENNYDTEILDEENPEEFVKEEIESLKTVIEIKNELLRKQEAQLVEYRDMIEKNLIQEKKRLEQENQELRMLSQRKTAESLYWTIQLNTLLQEVTELSNPPTG